MKKKIIFVAAAVFMAASVSVFTYISSERNAMDELFSANVEALANVENKDGFGTVIKKESSHTLICRGIGTLSCEW